jgi:hypothetical protein
MSGILDHPSVIVLVMWCVYTAIYVLIWDKNRLFFKYGLFVSALWALCMVVYYLILNDSYSVSLDEYIIGWITVVVLFGLGYVNYKGGYLKFRCLTFNFRSKNKNEKVTGESKDER